MDAARIITSTPAYRIARKRPPLYRRGSSYSGSIVSAAETVERRAGATSRLAYARSDGEEGEAERPRAGNVETGDN